MGQQPTRVPPHHSRSTSMQDQPRQPNPSLHPQPWCTSQEPHKKPQVGDRTPPIQDAEGQMATSNQERRHTQTLDLYRHPTPTSMLGTTPHQPATARPLDQAPTDPPPNTSAKRTPAPNHQAVTAIGPSQQWPYSTRPKSHAAACVAPSPAHQSIRTPRAHASHYPGTVTRQLHGPKGPCPLTKHCQVAQG